MVRPLLFVFTVSTAVRFTPAMRAPTTVMRDLGVSAVVVRGSAIGVHNRGVRVVLMLRPGVIDRSVSVSGSRSSSAGISMAAGVMTASRTLEAMTSPTVVITPVFPRSNSQKNAVVKISRSVISVGSARVGRVVVVAVRTGGRRAYVNCHLRISPCSHGDRCKQSRR
jgi:hypothetical protein